MAVGPVECVADVAQRPGQQRQEEAEAEPRPAAHEDEEGRAEKHVAEEVLAVGVQGEGRHGPVPFTERARPENVQRSFLDPNLGVEGGQAGQIRQKAPVDAHAMPEGKEQEKGQDPVGVLVGGERRGDGPRFAAFRSHGFQFGAGEALKQGGDVEAQLVAPARRAVGNAP